MPVIADPERARIRENVLYSVLDYVSQPAMMILAAPFLLKALGTQQYGTWMLVNSIAATASGLGGGFGDGATRYISMHRGRDDRTSAIRSLIAVLAINCALGLLCAVVIVMSAPLLIGHVFRVDPALRPVGIIALRISAFVLLVRFVEAVFTAAVRGYERYRPVVTISVIARLLVVVSSVILAIQGRGLVEILWATLVVGVMSLIAQAFLAHFVLQMSGNWLTADIRTGVLEVSSFGTFTWLKSVVGVLFGYSDRLLVAALLGTGPLAFFALCSQLTQPIHSLVASGFNFMFPNLSARSASGKWIETEKRYRAAVLVSACIVAGICLPMIFMARPILALWLGPHAAQQYGGLLVAMTIGNGLLALCIVPHYTALALGRSRALALMNLVTGVTALSSTYLLVKHIGIIGGGVAKVLAGLTSLYVFSVVRAAFRDNVGKAAEMKQEFLAGATFDLAR
jgi:O-antigen/teichoic acid export membrane protein